MWRNGFKTAKYVMLKMDCFVLTPFKAILKQKANQWKKKKFYKTIILISKRAKGESNTGVTSHLHS